MELHIGRLLYVRCNRTGLPVRARTLAPAAVPVPWCSSPAMGCPRSLGKRRELDMIAKVPPRWLRWKYPYSTVGASTPRDRIRGKLMPSRKFVQVAHGIPFSRRHKLIGHSFTEGR